MKWQDYIISDKEILLDKPVIKGTRISINHIISLLAQGRTGEKILDNYPLFSQESLNAVFTYLNKCLQNSLIYFPFKEAG